MSREGKVTKEEIDGFPSNTYPKKKSLTPKDNGLCAVHLLHDLKSMKDDFVRLAPYFTLKEVNQVIENSQKLYSRAITLRQEMHDAEQS